MFHLMLSIKEKKHAFVAGFLLYKFNQIALKSLYCNLYPSGSSLSFHISEIIIETDKIPVYCISPFAHLNLVSNTSQIFYCPKKRELVETLVTENASLVMKN